MKRTCTRHASVSVQRAANRGMRGGMRVYLGRRRVVLGTHGTALMV